MAPDWTPESILERARGFQESQPLLAAAELNLFEAVGSEGKTAQEVAESLKTDRRATEVLLNGLAAIGILIKTRERFAVPEQLMPLLAGAGECSLLPMLQHSAHVAHRWDQLVKVVRAGRSDDGTGLERMRRSEAEYRAFIQAMHVVGRPVADRIVGAIHPERFRRGLDVGGASGTYTIAMLRASPKMRATLFDLPPVIEMARERFQTEGLLDRVDLVAGDFYKDPLPGGHDLVFLSAIIHQNGPEQNRALYSKCFQALAPGGVIVIRDYIMDESHTQPVGGALFAINMLVNTEAGGTYSLSEIQAGLESAGFAETELVQQGPMMDALVTARRLK
jgi:predicted O-methyltransferase YrrM